MCVYIYIYDCRQIRTQTLPSDSVVLTVILVGARSQTVELELRLFIQWS